MNMIDSYEITSVKEYIDYVEGLPSEFSLARGQFRDYPLYPGIYRKDSQNMALYSEADKIRFIESFKIYAAQYLHDININNENELLVCAQHFGVNTCLLDFTYSPLLALLFAAENAFEEEADNDEADEDAIGSCSVVWFLNPSELNHKTLGDSQVINLSSFKSVEEIRAGMPFVCTANRNNKRIAAQNGLFVCFKNGEYSLENISIAKDILRKVVIHHKYLKSILASLYRLGLRFNKVYPELTSISKDIKLEYDVKQYIQNNEE